MNLIQPNQEQLRILNMLSRYGKAYIIGRSLFNEDSKDYDFVLLAESKCIDDVMSDRIFHDMNLQKAHGSSAENESFYWDDFIKFTYNGIEIDILISYKGEPIEDVISGFPLTIQQTWNTGGIFYSTSDYNANILEVSPKGRLKSGEELKKVMMKYLQYYPNLQIGVNFFKIMKNDFIGGDEDDNSIN